LKLLLAELFALAMLKQGVTITDAYFDFGVLARTLFPRFTERRRRTLRDSIDINRIQNSAPKPNCFHQFLTASAT
jgi:hypothetical protein